MSDHINQRGGPEVPGRRTPTGYSWVPEGVDHGQFNLNPHAYSSREEWMAASNLQSYAQDARERHPGVEDDDAPLLHHNPTGRERILGAAVASGQQQIQGRSRQARQRVTLSRARSSIASTTGERRTRGVDYPTLAPQV